MGSLKVCASEETINMHHRAAMANNSIVLAAQNRSIYDLTALQHNLEELLQKVDSGRVSRVPQMIADYAGNETSLIADLTERYSLNPRAVKQLGDLKRDLLIFGGERREEELKQLAKALRKLLKMAERNVTDSYIGAEDMSEKVPAMLKLACAPRHAPRAPVPLFAALARMAH